MKEIVTGIQAHILQNKYMVRVYRQTPDLKHLPSVREYSAYWSDKNKVIRLATLYNRLNSLNSMRLAEMFMKRYEVLNAKSQYNYPSIQCHR